MSYKRLSIILIINWISGKPYKTTKVPEYNSLLQKNIDNVNKFIIFVSSYLKPFSSISILSIMALSLSLLKFLVRKFILNIGAQNIRASPKKLTIVDNICYVF